MWLTHVNKNIYKFSQFSHLNEMFNKISNFILINRFAKNKLKFFRNVTNFDPIDKTNSNDINDRQREYLDSTNAEAIQVIKNDMKVLDDFVTEEEENCLLKEIEPYVKRLRYESSHWDNAIHEYRETERSNWTEDNQKVIDRVRRTAFPSGVAPIRTVHILDLAKNGVIKAHIDAIRFCGDTIAGISLLSSSVMRLVDEKDSKIFVDVLLKRRSLYIMSGIARYKFTHEILANHLSQFKGKAIPKDRRISVICRNEPIHPNEPNGSDPSLK